MQSSTDSYLECNIDLNMILVASYSLASVCSGDLSCYLSYFQVHF